MTDFIIPFPPVTPDDAEAAGYAQFNRNPHLCIDLPDGGFTITAKTSEGKRITFAFQPYKNGGPPQCVDIQYHDNGTTREFNGQTLATFDAILFGQTDARAVPIQLDTRQAKYKPGIVCVLMDKPKGGEQ
jgi:hypothetical protein